VYVTQDIVPDWARYTVVDRQGRVIGELRVPSDCAGVLTDRHLREWLESVDPAPLLELMA
jgi:hypothetical protein